MASDIKLLFNNDTGEADIKFINEDLVREDGLSTAVMMSLFTDRRANDDDALDDPSDKKGWWADFDDDLIGSRLWTVRRRTIDQKLLVEIKSITEEALQWMLDDGIAAKIVVTTEAFGEPIKNKVGLVIKVFKKDGTSEIIAFDDLWNAQFSEVV